MELPQPAAKADNVAGDLSRRWVLPPDAPYLANMAALWRADPELAEQIDAHDGQSYRTEPSRAGPTTVAVPTDDGRKIYLHSRYEPVVEARHLAESAGQGALAFYVHGFGLGYHVEALFDATGGEGTICVIEPDLLLLRTAFECRDLSPLLASGRVVFLTGSDKSELFTKLGGLISLLAMGTARVEHAPSVSREPALHAQWKEWTGQYDDYCRTTMNTAVHHGRLTAQNVSRNIARYAAAPGVDRLAGRYAGKPAIIVSAGPSLRKNKHLLREAAGKAVLIAVQTTLQPLVDEGIEPQFVTSLDYHDICTRFFERLPAGLKTELVAEAKASSKIFDLHPGPLSLVGNAFAEGLLREMQLNKPPLPAGATVAHLAYYLAEHLGCNPIIFVGQDLGFSDGLCYAPGTGYEDVWRPELGPFCTVEMKQWEQIARDRPILRRIPDQQGRPMYTEERLFVYLQQFERDFANSKAKIIDATEGGALKRGATVMPLAEALATYCREPLPTVPADHLGPNAERARACLAGLRLRQEEAGRIGDIAGQTLPLLEEIRDHLEDQSRVNRLIARVDALRSRMDELGACYDLVLQMTQSSEYDRFKADRQIAAAKLEGIERQRRQVSRDVENVRGMARAAAEFCRMIGDVIETITGQSATKEAA